MAAFETFNVPLILCGCFYLLLCVFSIVTGLIYLSGKRELNPLELSEKTMEKLADPQKRQSFARFMGGVTFVVGLVQGLSAFCLLKGQSPAFYGIALGFTLFSICSVLMKLKGKRNAFPLLKLVAYVAILVVLCLPGTRSLFFA